MRVASLRLLNCLLVSSKKKDICSLSFAALLCCLGSEAMVSAHRVDAAAKGTNQHPSLQAVRNAAVSCFLAVSSGYTSWSGAFVGLSDAVVAEVASSVANAREALVNDAAHLGRVLASLLSG